MALGPVGNVIFVNQQTPIAATLKADHNARLDFQNMAAAQIVNEKEKEVQELRPTEENHQVDPDREHQRQEADQEQKRSKEPQEKDKEENSPPIHHLDIKV